METIGFIDAILYSLPFILLCICCYKLNLSKPYRYRQFLLPIASIIFSFLIIYEIDQYNAYIQDEVQQNAWLYNLLASNDINVLKSRLVYIVNCAIALTFLLIKGVLLLLSWHWWKSKEVVESTSGLVYERQHGVLPHRETVYERRDRGTNLDTVVEAEEESESEESEEGKSKKTVRDWWVLRPEYRGFRFLFGGFYIACFVASFLFFLMSNLKPEWRVFSAVSYPVLAILMLGEFKSFLSGLDHIDEVKEAESKKPKKAYNPNFMALRKEILDLYGDRPLHDLILDSDESDAGVLLRDIEEYINPQSNKDGSIVVDYFNLLRSQKHELDMSYIETTLALMNGKSAIFFNPFYHDLTDYLLLPMARSLYRNRKCLIIVGRNSATDDVISWCESGIEEFFGTKALWQVGILSAIPNNYDIGVLKFSDIYRREVQVANADFFKDVSFIFLIEPSKILSTGQMGLSLLVSMCESDDEPIVYSACDRNCDGLVDSLSHVLRTKIINVSATLQNRATNFYFYWASEGVSLHHKIVPDIARYLGLGTSINVLALKHQIRPAKWMGGDKFPVHDIKWIDGQYYGQLCHAAMLPKAQAAWNEAFLVEPNLWQLGVIESGNFIVEDEFCNLFEMSRLFSTRYHKEGAIHVVSEHYMLRDYMFDNIDALLFDPKALPTIVPDFARTERNLVLKLIMKMSLAPLSELDIAKEFVLGGLISGQGGEIADDPISLMKQLFEKHFDISGGINNKWVEEKQANPLLSKPVRYCRIAEESSLSEFAKKLQAATFIAEDESGEKHFIGARLFGHVFQAFLPGQFLTSEGKYYQVQSITADSGVVVRRAADHIHSRLYYRQLRKTKITEWRADQAVASQREMSMHLDDQLLKIRTERGFGDIEISTEGYLQMDDLSDIVNAKKFVVNDIPVRKYKNKALLKIILPETTFDVRWTISLFFNEIFRTVFPEGYPYIFATLRADIADSVDLGHLASICRPLEPCNCNKTTAEDEETSHRRCVCDCMGIDEDAIVFVEDSDIDLGLLTAVERNIERFFEWMADFLNWHLGMVEAPVDEAIAKLEESIRKMKLRIEHGERIKQEASDLETSEEKIGLWHRFVKWVNGLFSSGTPAGTGGDADSEVTYDSTQVDLEQLEKDEARLRALRQMSLYQREGFLHLGNEAYPEQLSIEAVLDYLSKFGFNNSSISAVRKANDKHDEILNGKS